MLHLPVTLLGNTGGSRGHIRRMVSASDYRKNARAVQPSMPSLPHLPEVAGIDASAQTPTPTVEDHATVSRMHNDAKKGNIGRAVWALNSSACVSDRRRDAAQGTFHRRAQSGLRLRLHPSEIDADLFDCDACDLGPSQSSGDCSRRAVCPRTKLLLRAVHGPSRTQLARLRRGWTANPRDQNVDVELPYNLHVHVLVHGIDAHGATQSCVMVQDHSQQYPLSLLCYHLFTQPNLLVPFSDLQNFPIIHDASLHNTSSLPFGQSAERFGTVVQVCSNLRPLKQV